MPYVSFDSAENSYLAYILAGAFWLFFISGFLCLIPVSAHRKWDKKIKKKKGVAFFRFFRNKPAVIFDVLMISGIITLILSVLIIRTAPGWVTLAGTFTTVLSLEMHGLFNGRNYEYLYGS